LQALRVTDLKVALDPVLIASKGALCLGGDRDRIGIDFESRSWTLASLVQLGGLEPPT
jgi:hypothetical protein